MLICFQPLIIFANIFVSHFGHQIYFVVYILHSVLVNRKVFFYSLDIHDLPSELVKSQVDFSERATAQNSADAIVLKQCVRSRSISFERDFNVLLDLPNVLVLLRLLSNFLLVFSELLQLSLHVLNLIYFEGLLVKELLHVLFILNMLFHRHFRVSIRPRKHFHVACP